MDNQMNLYEIIGLERYGKEKKLWKALEACNELYSFVANNMDEIPDMKYDELYDFINKLLSIKYGLLELIGREEK